MLSITEKNNALQNVRKKGFILRDMPSEYQEDREIVLAAVSTYGAALQWASSELKNDSEIVLAAIEQHGGALEWASDTLFTYPFGVEAIQLNPSAIQCFSKKFDISRNYHLLLVAALKIANNLLMDSKFPEFNFRISSIAYRDTKLPNHPFLPDLISHSAQVLEKYLAHREVEELERLLSSRRMCLNQVLNQDDQAQLQNHLLRLKKSASEIKKNIIIMDQGSNHIQKELPNPDDNIRFFPLVPRDIQIVIAGYTGTHNVHNEEQVDKIAFDASQELEKTSTKSSSDKPEANEDSSSPGKRTKF